MLIEKNDTVLKIIYEMVPNMNFFFSDVAQSGKIKLKVWKVPGRKVGVINSWRTKKVAQMSLKYEVSRKLLLRVLIT